jgi:hypothetical protein
MANEFLTMSSEQLMDRLGTPGSIDTSRVLAELTRRQTIAATSSARWMKLSVAALVAANIIQIVLHFSN